MSNQIQLFTILKNLRNSIICLSMNLLIKFLIEEFVIVLLGFIRFFLLIIVREKGKFSTGWSKKKFMM